MSNKTEIIHNDYTPSELAALIRDAERYRKLRVLHWADGSLVVTSARNLYVGNQTFSGERLDETVDCLELEQCHRP